MSSIPVAYCIDLDEIVSISEARREYFRQPEPRQKFNFYCPDPSCKQKNGKRTQISAPNLYLPLFDPEHKKSRAPHFKIYQNQVHINECESIQYSQQNIIKDKDMSNALTTRSKHIKDNDYIDVFYRPGTKKSYAISIDKTAQGIHGTDITRTITSKVRGDSTRALSEKPSKTSTTFLMTLVDSYILARHRLNKETISQDDFDRLSFRIPNEKTYRYRDFFRKFQNVYTQSSFLGVHLGNCTVKNNANGWFLNFFDKIEGKRVFLFIHNNQLKKYRYKNNIMEILIRHEKAKFIKCYFLNPTYKISENYVQIILDDNELENLVLVLGTAIT